MKKILSLFLLVIPAGCMHLHAASQPEKHHFYEKAYALPVEAREWAASAPLEDLCQGKARNIDTRECYYTGMELTP